jgi:hypothetical protein
LRNVENGKHIKNSSKVSQKHKKMQKQRKGKIAVEIWCEGSKQKKDISVDRKKKDMRLLRVLKQKGYGKCFLYANIWTSTLGWSSRVL